VAGKKASCCPVRDTKVPETGVGHELSLRSKFYEDKGIYEKAILTKSPLRKICFSERLYVLSLPALRAFDDVKLHALALL
jgi:hypothetical protein